MAEVVGIRFKEVGKVYYFDPDGKTFEKGDRAIVETRAAWSAARSQWVTLLSMTAK